VRFALAQINPTVGDIAGNERLIAEQIAAARAQGAAVVLLPELAITGYPPEDLLLKEHFLSDARAAIERLAAQTNGIVAVVGFPERAQDVYNSAAVLAGGAVQAIYRKVNLPNYGVFDEARYFQAGTGGALIEVDGVTLGLTICEDIWTPGPPETDEARAGATIVLNISASPYHVGKGRQRELMVAQRARDNRAAFLFCGLVGGQDELVFDGHSFVVDHQGEVIARAAQFTPQLLLCELDPQAPATVRLRDPRQRAGARAAVNTVPVLAQLTSDAPTDAPSASVNTIAPLLPTDDEVYAALVLGTRDYVTKNGFAHVVIGLSGGVDSTLVTLIAVDALGAERVTCVTMPSRYSSDGTRGDAHALAANLGVELLELPIEAPREAYDALLADTFADRDEDLTEENLQARIRGNLLMALSNKFGWLVLTTGNKSEMSVGYSTLYGDSAGGFAVIKDVPKLLVYRLVAARRRRDGTDPVPETVVSRPPSAELRADQRDDDSLPPYEVLDAILEGYVEEDLGADQLVARGLPADDVARIIRLVDLAEYKRRQNPPGIKITEKAFGRDRRVPITNRYRG
jgi:NAD+ synthase (glutamine-hydrolysing)